LAQSAFGVNRGERSCARIDGNLPADAGLTACLRGWDPDLRRDFDGNLFLSTPSKLYGEESAGEREVRAHEDADVPVGAGRRRFRFSAHALGREKLSNHHPRR
jgi:hypothetical protein